MQHCQAAQPRAAIRLCGVWALVPRGVECDCCLGSLCIQQSRGGERMTHTSSPSMDTLDFVLSEELNNR